MTFGQGFNLSWPIKMKELQEVRLSTVRMQTENPTTTSPTVLVGHNLYNKSQHFNLLCLHHHFLFVLLIRQTLPQHLGTWVR